MKIKKPIIFFQIILICGCQLLLVGMTILKKNKDKVTIIVDNKNLTVTNHISDYKSSGYRMGLMNYIDNKLLLNFYKGVTVEEDYEEFYNNYINNAYGSESDLIKHKKMYMITDKMLDDEVKVAYKEMKYTKTLGDSFGLTEDSIKSVYEDSPESYNYCTISLVEFDTEQEFSDARLNKNDVIDGKYETSVLDQNIYLNDVNLGIDLMNCKENLLYTSEYNKKYYAFVITNKKDSFEKLKTELMDNIKTTMGNNKLQEELKAYYNNVKVKVAGDTYDLSDKEE